MPDCHHPTNHLKRMPQVIVSTGGGIVDGKLVAALRPILLTSINSIATALRDGSPLFDDELFVPWQGAQFARLRHLINALHTHGIEPLVWEDGHSIHVQVLLNIMQSSDDSLEKMVHLGGISHDG